jgi:hypothetical protein
MRLILKFCVIYLNFSLTHGPYTKIRVFQPCFAPIKFLDNYLSSCARTTGIWHWCHSTRQILTDLRIKADSDADTHIEIKARFDLSIN